MNFLLTEEKRNGGKWIIECGKTPLKCVICGGETIVKIEGKNAFSICLKCNPYKMIEMNFDGCDAICMVCFSAWTYDNDNVTPCLECGRFICEYCEYKCHVDGPDDDGTYHCSGDCLEKYMKLERKK